MNKDGMFRNTLANLAWKRGCKQCQAAQTGCLDMFSIQDGMATGMDGIFANTKLASTN